MFEKVYVKVKAEFDHTGYMMPKSIFWEDGREFKIDEVLNFRPLSDHAPEIKRYMVSINGKKKFLYYEKADPMYPAYTGRWFVAI